MNSAEMERENQRNTIEAAKSLELVQYLSKLGYEPTKIRHSDYWYLSPLRDESVPSFKVNRRINRWFDHGLGKGGNLVDFGIRYHRCSVGEFLKMINSDLYFHQPVNRHLDSKEKEHKITVLQDLSLSSFALLKYLEQRKIPVEIAEQFCREVRYELNNKIYYGIGFRNDSGGYEIRNPYFKASSSPKDVTSIKNGTQDVSVFEGFTDFLSFMAIHQHEDTIKTDFLILNSASFFERARPFMEHHENIRLYLDRDTTGRSYTQYAMSLNGKYKDESSLYSNHKDLNEWLIDTANNRKKTLKKKLR